MYEVGDIIDALRNPRKIIRELNTLYHRRLRYYDHNPDGVDIFAEDWANLILLDACRYDTFLQEATLPGQTETRQTRGTHSREFVRGNFAGRTLHDTVIVTANFWYDQINDIDVHDIVYVTGEEYDEGYDGRATPPEAVTSIARETANRYPNKRLIVHYMQPHRPFLGPVGKDIHAPEPLTEKILSGEFEVSNERLWTAYRENLNIVLDDVETLLNDLQGRTVVSADHGELMGERQRPFPIRTWGHAHGVYVDELATVPWHVYDEGERREITTEAPAEAADSGMDEATVNERLEQLGYLQTD